MYFMQEYICYDVMVISFKLVIFDIILEVRSSFYFIFIFIVLQLLFIFFRTFCQVRFFVRFFQDFFLALWILVWGGFLFFVSIFLLLLQFCYLVCVVFWVGYFIFFILKMGIGMFVLFYKFQKIFGIIQDKWEYFVKF